MKGLPLLKYKDQDGEHVVEFTPQERARIRRVIAFREQHPDSEYGKGHNVISDYNVDDESIETCVYWLNKQITRLEIKECQRGRLTVSQSDKLALAIETRNFFRTLLKET